MIRCNFFSNTAGNNFGAIYIASSTNIAGNNYLFTIKDSNFTANSAPSYGCVYSQGAGLYAQNSIFDRNTAAGKAGVSNNGMTLINNCTFTNNRASGTDSGALYSAGGDITIQNSKFQNNYASGSGSAVQVSGMCSLQNHLLKKSISQCFLCDEIDKYKIRKSLI